MKTMTVGEFKAKFSEVIAQVKKGEEIAVTFGKKKEIVGYFKPEVATPKKREHIIGLLEETPGYYMAKNFCETTEEEFPINELPL